MGKYARRGIYKVRCDISGFMVDSDQCRKRWDGLYVRKDLWEPRHPLDYVPSTKDKIAPPIVRPEGESVFISSTDITAEDL